MTELPPDLIKKTLKTREKMNQIGIVIARDRETDGILGFKFIPKTNVHFDLDQIFGKEINQEFITQEFFVGEGETCLN